MPSTMWPSQSNTGAQKPHTPGSSVSTTRARPRWRTSFRIFSSSGAVRGRSARFCWRARAISSASSGAIASLDICAAKQRPVADDSSGMTSPRRRLTLTVCGDSSQCTIVGPRLPHTASASVWPICSISGPMRSRASFTASSREREASPNLSAAGPRS